MSTVLPPDFDSAGFGEPSFPVRRFSVAEYQRLGEAGILTEDDSVELLEGLIVPKMTKYPRHDGTIDQLAMLLAALLPAGWYPRIQNVLITSDSAPEPDVVVTRGAPRDYWRRHPTAADVALVIEVAESSLARDWEKRRIYAHAGVSNYWIVDLINDRLEVFTEPDTAAGRFNRHECWQAPSSVVLSLPTGESITLNLTDVIPTAGE